MNAINEFEVTNLATLLEAARDSCGGFGFMAYWYRGHACEDWSLVPSVHRSYDSIGERSLYARFKNAAPTRHGQCANNLDAASWLCLMQHYGLPTRLLDWTGSLIAAVFFAVSYESKPGPGAIWILLPTQLNRASRPSSNWICHLNGPEAVPLLSGVLVDTAPIPEVLAVTCPDVDIRMSVQQGAFTIHGDNTPLETMPDSGRYLAKLAVPATAKAVLEEELWVLGVRRSMLFPDLANLAQDLASDWRTLPKKTELALPVKK